jgi:hypothetical protein
MCATSAHVTELDPGVEPFLVGLETPSLSPARVATSTSSVASSSCLCTPPGHLECLRSQRGLPIGREAGVTQRAAGEAGEQPDAQRAVIVAERRDHALDQRHQELVVP